jgi:hypothetical protein
MILSYPSLDTPLNAEVNRMPIDNEVPSEKIKIFAGTVVTIWEKEIRKVIDHRSVGFTFPIWIGTEENTSVFVEELAGAMKERQKPAIFGRFEILSGECDLENADGGIAENDTKYRKVSLRLK